MKYIIKLIIPMVIIGGVLAMPAFADEANDVIDHPELLYQAKIADNSVLRQKITINRKFNNLNELITSLNSMRGISTFVRNKSATPPVSVLVQLDNATVLDLLNVATPKLGYSFTLKNDVVVFTAITPQTTLTPYHMLPAVGASNLNAEIAPPLMWQLNPQDRTLRSALTKWCKTAHWQLVWNVNADYPIITTWNIAGSFETAVNEVLQASQTTNVPLLAIMHDKNHVLEVYSK